jgi:hypothetical protein
VTIKQRDEVLGVKIVGGLPEASTLWAGVSLLVELFRRSGVDEVANKDLPAKGSTKGLSQGETVAIRLRRQQREVFRDDTNVRHFFAL